MIIDISWPISKGMTAYKNKRDKKPKIKITKIYSKKGVNESQITLSSHTGTHVDAPKHFLAKGKTLDKVKLETFVGTCQVVEFKVNKITAKELRKIKLKRGEILLCKTKNSKLKETAKFNKNFVYVDKTAAKYLAAKKVRAVGIDYLGIETKQPGHETHKTLLRNNIGIIEGLRLKNVKPGKYTLVCLPLKIGNVEAAPARAILIR